MAHPIRDAAPVLLLAIPIAFFTGVLHEATPLLLRAPPRMLALAWASAIAVAAVVVTALASRRTAREGSLVAASEARRPWIALGLATALLSLPALPSFSSPATATTSERRESSWSSRARWACCSGPRSGRGRRGCSFGG